MSRTVEPSPAVSATFYFCCSVFPFSYLSPTGRRVWLSKAREFGGGFSAFEGGSWPLFGSAHDFSRASMYHVFRFWAALLRVHAAAHRGQHIASHRTALPSIAQCISASHTRVFNIGFFDPYCLFVQFNLFVHQFVYPRIPLHISAFGKLCMC